MNISAEIDDMEKPIQSAKEPNTPIQESKKKDNQNLNFLFQVNRAKKLKQALEALTDADFNPNGLGFIEVEEKGLEITVRNPNIEVVGYLWFKSSCMINFEFNSAMKNKLINLNCIRDNLVHASNDDTVTLFHLHGSSQLNFMFENAGVPRQFAVDLVHIEDGSLEKFPFLNIECACEAIIISHHFRDIIEKYQALENNLRAVLVHITDQDMKVYVGLKDWLLYKQLLGIKQMKPNTSLCAWFRMQHHRALNKASSMLTAGPRLCPVTNPPEPEQIMLRFELRELGELVFVSKAEFLCFHCFLATYSDFMAAVLGLAALPHHLLPS